MQTHKTTPTQEQQRIANIMQAITTLHELENSSTTYGRRWFA